MYSGDIMKEGRLIYFDYMRIISIFAVVVLHVSAQNWKNIPIDTFEWNIFTSVNSLTRWCVPVFVMISGALFLEKEQSIKKLFTKNIFRMAVILAVWSTLYAIWDYKIIHSVSSLKSVLYEVVTGHYHLWFLYMLIALYMIIPLLYKITEKTENAIYFVILAFVFTLLLPNCISIIRIKSDWCANLFNTVLTNTNMNFVGGYTVYFILGYILNKKNIPKKAELLIFFAGLLSAAITVVGTVYLSRIRQTPATLFLQNTSVNVFFMSMAVFVFGKKYLNKAPVSEKGMKTLLLFSKCSLGVYLIHLFILEGAEKLLHITTLSFNPLISVPFFSFVTFFAAMAISLLLNKIPVVNKWII